MNTSALKAFAPAVRRALMEAVDRKLDVVLAAQSPDYLTTYAPQVAALRELAGSDRGQLVERVAYSWFNRFAALRYLDARGWHPFRARVLTASGDEIQPELLRQMRAGALPTELVRHTDPARLNDLLDGRIPSADPQGEVYRHLVLAACRFYHALLPDLFERLDDATELLLPDDLLTEHSVVQGFRTEISDEDCADVEILGWLYQFYISERKDEVMARKSAVPTEDIPAVTQLFTPHWIVRYLVENSLGRLWLLNRPGSRLREQMPYYIEGDAETEFLRVNSPEEIRLCDPAVGSGHMLTYAFDLLYAIYEEEGYAAADIPGLILRHNLVGLDIDARAAQLASLALVLKARERDPRYFEAGQLVQPQIIELQDIHFDKHELRDYSQALELESLFDEPMLRLLHQFEEAKTFGSLITPSLDAAAIAGVRRAIKAKAPGDMVHRVTHDKIMRVLDQAEALTQRYQIVVANPPYMGSANFNPAVKKFSKTHYLAAKKNLFAMFMTRNQGLLQPRGYSAMITLQDWMFISSFEDFRASLLHNVAVVSLLHLGPRAFDSISGEIVQTVAFVLEKNGSSEYKGLFHDLVQGINEDDKEKRFLVRDSVFQVSPADILAVTGAPVAYWISGRVRQIFRTLGLLRDVVAIRAGMATGNNETFVRAWTEVSRYTLATDRPTKEVLWSDASLKWVPFNKGGEFRKWYGNNTYVISYDRASYALLKTSGNQCPSEDYYFRQNLTWSDVTSASFGVRLTPQGSVFSSVGNSIFGDDETLVVAGCFLCSKIADSFLRILNPTLHCNPGEVGALPFEPSQYPVEQLRAWFATACTIARTDWDNFETSWDFRDPPLLRPGLKGATLEVSWRNWEGQCTTAISRMQELETENNRLFIAAYGLEGELEPEVPEEQITLARADTRKDMAAFLSYAVGCMMGRYSLDHPGLILANAGDTLQAYLAKVGRSQDQLTFVPDEDGIIPVLEGEWFEDDVVARTREFLRVTFGEATLRENMRFIEEALGKDLRKYFLTDFYKDHLQTYKKRPIYWMVQSPKKGFAVLIYLHRYTRDTLNVVLNRYLREFQGKLRSRLAHLERTPTDELSARDRTAVRKETERLTKVLHECEEWERQTLLPLAQERIALDLDDGVKVNYRKLSEALAPIPGLAAADD